MTIGCNHPRPKLDLPGYSPPRFAWQPPTVIPTDPASMARVLAEQFRGIYAVLQQLGQRRVVVPLIEDIDARAGQVIVGVGGGQTIRLPEAVDGELSQVSVVLTDVSTPVTLIHPDGTEQEVGTAGAYDFVSGLPEVYQTNPGGTTVASMPGLSVLGRAASSAGAAAAITASAARQVPRVVDAGTSVAWGFPLEAQLNDADQGDVHTINREDGRLTVSGGIATLGLPQNTVVNPFAATTHNAYALPATVLNDDILSLIGAGSATLNGIDATGVQPGFRFYLQWSDAGTGDGRTLTINDESSSATATDRISCPGDLPVVLQTGSSVLVIRSATRWGLFFGKEPIAAESFLGNFTASTTIPAARAGSSVAGAGLTYTAGGTLAVGAGTRITVNANDVQLAAGAAESFLMNATSGSAVADYRAGSSVAGAGLTYTAGGTLAVGAGTGISVAADAVSVANIPLTALANQADDTFLANIAGSAAPPTAVALTTLAGAGLTGGADAILAVGAGTGITVNANDVQLTTIADDTFMANVSGAAAVATGKTFTSLAGDGLTYDATNHELDVVGSTSITVTSDQVQRAALSGAITAALNSNTTEFTGIRWNGGFTNAVGFLNFIDSTSNIVVMADDAVNDETEISIQRAALTGAIAASQNSNATVFAGILDNGAAENNRTNLNFLNGTNTTATVTDDSGNDELEIRVNVDDFPLSGLADQAAETFVGNFTAGSAAPTARAGSSVAGGGLTYTAGGTLAVGAGTRITVNADDVQLAAGAAESFLGNFTAGSAVADYRAGSSVAGGGLTYTAGGTLAVGAGTGITVNANDIAVTIPLTDGDKGDITVSSSGTNWQIDASAVGTAELSTAVAGNGLTGGGGSALAVGAGTGISVAADSVAIDQSANLTWTGSHNFSGAVLFTDDHVETGALPYNITIGDTVNKLFINTAGDGEIQTIGGTTSAGRIVEVYILASGLKTIKHSTGAGSLQMPGSRDHVLSQGQSFKLIGNNPGSGWRVSYVPIETAVQSRLIGRAEGGGTGIPTALTPTQTVAIIDGENATWTGVHSFTGSSHTINVTGAANISADAASLITTSVGDIEFSTTDAAGTLRLESRGGSGTSGGAEIRMAGAIVLEATNIVRVSTGDPFTERLEIETDGAWQVNGNTGTAGQALCTQGNAASPEWQVPFVGNRASSVGSVTNSTTPVTLASYSIPANTLAAGSTFTFHGSGRYIRGATATASNLTYELRIAGTAIGGGSGAKATRTVNGQQGGFSIRGVLACTATGASGNIMVFVEYVDDIVTALNYVTTRSGGSQTVDTTAAIVVDMRAFFSVAVGSLQIQQDSGIIYQNSP